MLEIYVHIADLLNKKRVSTHRWNVKQKSKICTANTFTVKPIKHDRTSAGWCWCIETCSTARWHVSHVLTFLRFYCLDINISEYFLMCCFPLLLILFFFHLCFDTCSLSYAAHAHSELTDIDVCVHACERLLLFPQITMCYQSNFIPIFWRKFFRIFSEIKNNVGKSHFFVWFLLLLLTTLLLLLAFHSFSTMHCGKFLKIDPQATSLQTERNTSLAE